MSCCDAMHGSEGQAAGEPAAAKATQEKFLDFMKAAGAPGALDARTKRVLAVALSVLARCEPCAKIHIRKAKEAGLSQEEIDEAAWMAVSFGGCSAMMFYNEVKKI